MTDTEKLYKIKPIIAWMLLKYKEDKEFFQGFSAIDRLNNRAPEDDCESRTDWYTIRDYADDMYYMLDALKDSVDKIQEIIDGDE